MSDTLGDRLRARRAAARQHGDTHKLRDEIRAYIDEKIAALCAENGLTPP